MKKIKFFLTKLLSIILLVAVLNGYSYAWTVEYMNLTPRGHEILTKNAAYSAGSYYTDNDSLFGYFKLSDLPLISQTDYKIFIIEAGFLKKVWKKAKKVANSVSNAVSTVVSVAADACIAVAPILADVGGLIASYASGITEGPQPHKPQPIVPPSFLAPMAVDAFFLIASGFNYLLNKILPYYGTYNKKTASIIAGARYQDLRSMRPLSSEWYRTTEDPEDQKFHFLRKNNNPLYNDDVFFNEMESKEHGIRHTAIYKPLYKAFCAQDGPQKHHNIGAYDLIKVEPHHFAMGKLLHTIQDSFAHTDRAKGNGFESGKNGPYNGWSINHIRVYEPKKGASKFYQHEDWRKTMFSEGSSHDRIDHEDHGVKDKKAKEAQEVSKILLVNWKNRDKKLWKQPGFDYEYFKRELFTNPDNPWGQVLNYVCKHRLEHRLTQ